MRPVFSGVKYIEQYFSNQPKIHCNVKPHMHTLNIFQNLGVKLSSTLVINMNLIELYSIIQIWFQ